MLDMMKMLVVSFGDIIEKKIKYLSKNNILKILNENLYRFLSESKIWKSR